jgi:cysteine desulfurase
VVNLLHELRPNTTLVSIMMVNNEVGTIQHIKAIGDILKDANTLFHCDAVQALGSCAIDVEDMCIDMLSISSHKIHGPKGVGALYVRKGTPIQKLVFGGEQEFNRRGGTLNVAGIVGFGKAVEITKANMAQSHKKLRELSTYFIKKVQYEISDITINGNLKQKVPGIVNISFNLVDGESLLMLLDLEGIAVSTGSACSAGSIEKSHVLRAMGLKMKDVSGAVRFSFGVDNTKEEIDYVVDVLAKSVDKLRDMTALTKKRKVVKK